MTDIYSRRSAPVTSQGRTGLPVTPSDSVNFHEPAKALYIGSAGTVSIVDVNDNTIVLQGVAAGTTYSDLQIKRVNATGTTATNIIAVFTHGVGFNPLSIAGATLNYDFNDLSSLTVASGVITGVANKAIVGSHNLLAQAAGGANYVAQSPVHGNACADWGNILSKKGYVLPADVSVKDIFVVLCYKDGVQARFDEFNTIFTSLAQMTAPGANRVCGSQNNPTLHNSSAFPNVGINGGAIAANSVLPTKHRLLRLSNAAFPLGTIGGEQFGSTRGWQGSMCEILAYSAATTLTDTQVSQITDHLISKWNIKR